MLSLLGITVVTGGWKPLPVSSQASSREGWALGKRNQMSVPLLWYAAAMVSIPCVCNSWFLIVTSPSPAVQAHVHLVPAHAVAGPVLHLIHRDEAVFGAAARPGHDDRLVHAGGGATARADRSRSASPCASGPRCSVHCCSTAARHRHRSWWPNPPGSTWRWPIRPSRCPWRSATMHCRRRTQFISGPHDRQLPVVIDTVVEVFVHAAEVVVR
jgi:hypothetical protein